MIEQCKTPSHNTEAQKPSSASELCWQICRTVKNQLGAAIIGAAVQMLTSSQASALSPLTLHARSLFGVVALLFFFLSRFCPRRSKPLHHDKTCRGRDVPKRERERTHSVEGENTHTHIYIYIYACNCNKPESVFCRAPTPSPSRSATRLERPEKKGGG
jgi:hypothetical protein